MSNTPQTGEDWMGAGCAIVMLMMAIPYFLTQLFSAVMPFIIVGIGIAILLGSIYWIYNYDKDTGNITQLFEHAFNLDPSGRNKHTYVPKEGLEDLKKKVKNNTKKINKVAKSIRRQIEKLEEARLRDMQDHKRYTDEAVFSVEERIKFEEERDNEILKLKQLEKIEIEKDRGERRQEFNDFFDL